MAQEETAKNAKLHRENSINIMGVGVETRQDESLDNGFENGEYYYFFLLISAICSSLAFLLT